MAAELTFANNIDDIFKPELNAFLLGNKELLLLTIISCIFEN